MAFSRCPWKEVAIVTLMVATVVVVVAVAVAVPTLLCHRGGDRNSLEVPDVTNRSLAEARGRWQRCKEELGALQAKILELEQALANVTRLEEQNLALGTELQWQREQLEQEQSLRAQLQRQNRLLQEQLQDAQSQRSAGDRLPVSPGVPVLLLLLLLGMLLP